MKRYQKDMLASAYKDIIEQTIGLTSDLRFALEKLLIEGKIYGVAKGVTEQVLTRGKPSLSPKQLHVFEQYVIKKFKLEP